MTLTRKHYVAIADIVKEHRDYLEWLGENRSMPPAKDDEREFYPTTIPKVIKMRKKDACALAKDMARYFAEDNPNFDYDRFLKATNCWVDN